MSLAIDSVDRVDGITVVRVLPSRDARGLEELTACWRAFQEDATVRAVAVVTSAEDFSSALPAVPPDDLGTIGPKSMGLIKPFGLALRGDVLDYALDLLGEADTVLAADNVRIADTSAGSGNPAVHAGRLGGSLPDAEINRLALLGVSSAMTAERARELGLVDEIVDMSHLERRLVQRLQRFIGREDEDDSALP